MCVCVCVCVCACVRVCVCACVHALSLHWLSHLGHFLPLGGSSMLGLVCWQSCCGRPVSVLAVVLGPGSQCAVVKL